MITKKQRIELRSKASLLKPVVMVGKDGFSENVLKQIEEELFNHELIKISLLDTTTGLTDYELSSVATQLGAEVVTTIGKKIVLYKHSEKKNIKHVLA